MAIRETIHKVLNVDKTLWEKLRTLFTEQGVTITSEITAIGMTIAVVVEAILLGTRSAVSAVTPAPKPVPPKPKPDPGPHPGPKPPKLPDSPKTWADWFKA